MKKRWLILVLLAVASSYYAQPNIKTLRFPTEADFWGLFEVSFSMNDYSNPYDPEVIHAYAEFFGPNSQSFTVDAFYYEGYDFSRNNENIEVPERRRGDQGWKIRFTPNAVGEWKFVLHAIDAKGAKHLNAFKGTPFVFHCKEVASANGFITKANTRFLKREVVTNGQRSEKAFFPVGLNIAWYDAADFGRYAKPYGIYDYIANIDSMAGNVNFMRMWINRYQFLALYGPENTELVNGKPRMYFDSSLNQKDSAELDFIVQYAKEHDISIMPCIFNFRNFQHKKAINPPTNEKPAMPSDWINNPYHIVLGLDTPYQFFTDPEAKRISKNLIRYIVARYGYATNILCWEFWNEVANMSNGQVLDEKTQKDIAAWHDEMASFLRSIDPYHHLISTSLGSKKNHKLLYSRAFDNLDVVQFHNYQNIQKASSLEQFSSVLLKASLESFTNYNDKPFFMGEFGFDQDKPENKYALKDPYGIDLHNSLWSSAFSCSMGPASFWYWQFIKRNQMFVRFHPVFVFLSNLPIPSDTFIPKTTGEANKRTLVFPNHLQTYYMINAAEDTIYGWSQDTAFAYQSLRYLTDPVGDNHHFVLGKVNDPQGYVYTLSSEKKPKASSRSNTIKIPIGNQPVGTRYAIRWFDSETGLEIPSEATTGVVKGSWFTPKVLSFEFPSSIRDPKTLSVNNTFGDAVFMIYKVQ